MYKVIKIFKAARTSFIDLINLDTGTVDKIFDDYSMADLNKTNWGVKLLEENKQMIEKQAGLVNETVYNYIVFCNGKWHQNLTPNNLSILAEKIIETHATTKYLRFIPFYRNLKEKRQVEFDDYMLYLECRNVIDEDAENLHIEECMGKSIQEMGENEIRRGMIQFPLCRYDDPDTYSLTSLFQ